MNNNDVRNLVKEHYGQEARRVLEGSIGGPVSADPYDEADREAVPAEALQASLGCGNPAALARLRPGEVVLDLGSGGGIDVLLSARRVGPDGKAYGLDMTDEMLALAEENKKRSGLANAEFLKGEIEDVPLPNRLEAAGFTGIEVQPTRAFTQDEAHDFLAAAGLDAGRLAPQVAGKVISAFVRAVKP